MQVGQRGDPGTGEARLLPVDPLVVLDLYGQGAAEHDGDEGVEGANGQGGDADDALVDGAA